MLQTEEAQMQDIQGWDTEGHVHVCHSPTSRRWQGQWETTDHCDRSGKWETGGNWGSLSNIGNGLDDFENIMKWDDSGALEAYQIANERREAFFRGLIYPIPLPSPELYIQTIDWENNECVDLSDFSENWSHYRENSGQRKRDRHSGSGFKCDKRESKHGSRQCQNESFDSKRMNQLMSNQSNQPQTKNQWDQERSYNAPIGERQCQKTYSAACSGPSIDRQATSGSVMSHGVSGPAFTQRPVYSHHIDRFHPSDSQMWLPRCDSQLQQNHSKWHQERMPGGSKGLSTSNISHGHPQGMNNHRQYNGNGYLRK